ncbi:MAG: SMI1/KNR4 family protein [Blastopirellula sp.]|nr:MAG: SMI1/KNR4 family protein [Blastopirellula sp.]
MADNSSLAEDISYVHSQLTSYAKLNSPQMGVASSNGGAGVPHEMFDGEVDDEGWVAWKMLPSTLSLDDVTEVEQKFSVQFPPLFRTYLLAGFQLYDQIISSKYEQLIFNTDVPSIEPLQPIRTLIESWSSLTLAGYVPFAQWGDGWGPMCFDIENRHEDGDCSIVWMDHELLIPLGPIECGKRISVLPHVNELYCSYREFFDDTFGVSKRIG